MQPAVLQIRIGDEVLGNCEWKPFSQGVEMDGRKLACGTLNILDSTGKRIGSIVFSKGGTLISFADGTKVPLQSPTKRAPIVFFDEAYFKDVIVAGFAVTMLKNPGDNDIVMYELGLSCVSPLKNQRLARTLESGEKYGIIPGGIAPGGPH